MWAARTRSASNVPLPTNVTRQSAAVPLIVGSSFFAKSFSSSAAGPTVTTKSAGRMKSANGSSILIGSFRAASSAR